MTTELKSFPNAPTCHFTPVEYEAGESDGLGVFEEWFICRHCGHTKDASEALREAG